MRKALILIFLWLISYKSYSCTTQADPVELDPFVKNYYLEAYGLKGEELFKSLQKIISRDYHARGYSTLYKELAKSFANTDGVILDYYSTNPHGQNPYEYKAKNKCGTYKQEGDCFNREHIFPQGIFGKKMPMKSDYHHIIPTDGYVNNRRNRFPFGEVGSVQWESQNGSKLGRAINSDYQGKVFEPLDEYKGDIARALFYFAARYQKRGMNWKNVTLNNKTYLFYTDWYIVTLKRWHEEDPVDDGERKRHEAGYKFQKNRNPFIDHPEWVELIW